ncbi:MAG: D-alanyl-D-alanine carboxypeptidase [Deltaproteobacteria bacterium]|jgi:D-alanyl-D-alanine carboxypeptidase/D-alanyl-D-alanine-endopeptidase (penicillin-binding protein 4)|nr:D-alanyl-D-alanine carboxypeptidase [Deltaproteobacteria bacterium]
MRIKPESIILSKPAIFFTLLFCFLLLFQIQNLHAENIGSVANLIGDQDAVLVADHQGGIIVSKNTDKKLIPASTLKILTSLVAMHYLGPDYRFTTEFYLDNDSNLKIKGYGDPLLTSEILEEISKALGSRLDAEHKKIKDIVLDDSYFRQPITIPGISSSSQPYDAPNGALCANFNTVYFKRLENGKYVSAEEQTPLLPFALRKVRKSKLTTGRLVLSHKESENTLYFGHLFKYFLEKQGIKSNSSIRLGRVNKENDRLVFKYVSGFSIKEIISKLLEHSNNFMANQLLISAGTKLYGPPGTLDKGVLAAKNYAENILNLKDLCIVEGSGISRKNKISAKSLYKTVEAFFPYHDLMQKKEREFYKTGTLKDINTRAGYIRNKKGGLYRFVVLINTQGKSAEPIMNRLLKVLK